MTSDLLLLLLLSSCQRTHTCACGACLFACAPSGQRFNSKHPVNIVSPGFTSSHNAIRSTSKTSVELRGFEPRTPALQRQCSSQLSYSPLHCLVGLGGLEPPTSRLSGVRSNHLSYKPRLAGYRHRRWSPAAASVHPLYNKYRSDCLIRALA